MSNWITPSWELKKWSSALDIQTFPEKNIWAPQNTTYLKHLTSGITEHLITFLFLWIPFDTFSQLKLPNLIGAMTPHQPQHLEGKKYQFWLHLGAILLWRLYWYMCPFNWKNDLILTMSLRKGKNKNINPYHIIVKYSIFFLHGKLY